MQYIYTVIAVALTVACMVIMWIDTPYPWMVLNKVRSLVPRKRKKRKPQNRSRAMIDSLPTLKNDKRWESLSNFDKSWTELSVRAKGSKSNHQAWMGGYVDHLKQCFHLAQQLGKLLRKDEDFINSALVVLYFHDIEKMWKYTSGLHTANFHLFDKWQFYTETLPEQYGIEFSAKELNALKYIHGEGTDYRSNERVMGPLAAFCHMVDVCSARMYFDKTYEELLDSLEEQEAAVPSKLPSFVL